MKIYTKTGDEGTTSLVGGERVSKASLRVNAYGDVDELISHLGVLRSETDEDLPLKRIQCDLMKISAHFASGKDIPALKKTGKEDIAFLEEQIDSLTAKLPPMNFFVLPAGPRASADCHVARTVCRRAERSAIAMDSKTEQDSLGIRYLNRLSDYLFTLARYLCIASGAEEDRWIP